MSDDIREMAKRSLKEIDAAEASRVESGAFGLFDLEEIERLYIAAMREGMLATLDLIDESAMSKPAFRLRDAIRAEADKLEGK